MRGFFVQILDVAGSGCHFANLHTASKIFEAAHFVHIYQPL